MINIFEYQNYRLYLKDYYQEQKNSKKYFSYRFFSKKAGINASAFLYYVIEGKRNLTKNSISKISVAIGHSKDERDYFENLVFFNQAETIEEKTIYYSRIAECRKPLDIKTIDKEQYEFYTKWYHSVIREIIPLINFKDNYTVLSKAVTPAISPKEARESVALLERLGLIERDDDGLFHQTSALIRVKPDAQDTFIIEKFQMEMLDIARLSYDQVPRGDRLSTSTTVSISHETFELIKLKTREFRKELLEIVKLDNSPDRVYQITLNLFPLSRSLNEISN